MERKTKMNPIGRMSCWRFFTLNKSVIPSMAPYVKIDALKKTVISKVNTTIASSLQ